VQLPENVVYAIWQREKAPETGREHWQGFVIFDKNVRFNRVRSMFNGEAHVEPAYGTSEQCRAYCSKEESRVPGTQPTEVGHFPGNPGHRSDIDNLLADIQAGLPDKQLLLEHAGLFIRCPVGFREAVRRLRPMVPVRYDWLYAWQSKLLNELTGNPDPRKVIWYVDQNGGCGKSFIARILARNLDADIYAGGKCADCAYACTGSRIQCFDLSREKAEFFSYDFIEQVKNGMVFSTKYESGRKMFDIPHVVIFSNWYPDQLKLTHDRWDLRRCDDMTRVMPLGVGEGGLAV